MPRAKVTTFRLDAMALDSIAGILRCSERTGYRSLLLAALRLTLRMT